MILFLQHQKAHQRYQLIQRSKKGSKMKNISLVKFAVVAAMVGFFSPSVSVNTTVSSGDAFSTMPIAMSVSLFTQAEARRGGGGGGARRGGGANRNQSVNRNRNTNRNTNRNVNRNVNKNVNVNHNNRYYGRRGYYGGRALVGFATGLAIGTMVSAASMPATCVTTYVNGISYRKCGSSYYQPFYEGDTVAYKVVSSPY